MKDVTQTIYNYTFIINDDHIIPDDCLLKYVKNKLTEKRFIHSLSVANLAYRIAIANNLNDPIKYYLVGLIHDIAKYYSKEKTYKIMQEKFPEYINLPEYAYHSFVGAYLAETELGIKDKDFLYSIMMHTTGNRNLSDLSLVLYASDKIEPNRTYNTKPLIDAMLNNYKTGFKIVLIDVRNFLHDKRGLDNYLTDLMFEFYL